MRKKIAIFCGGPSSEHEVSINSASTIFKFIDKEKYELYYFYISKDFRCKLLEATHNVNFKKIKTDSDLFDGLNIIKSKKIFCLLAGIHGEFVEDGKLQTILEYLRIKYSGSLSYPSALAMDKFRSSIIVGKIQDLELPMTRIFDKNFKVSDFTFPVIVKPNTLGSSVGVSIVNSEKELNLTVKELLIKYPYVEILIQEYLDGALEFSCGVLEKNGGEIIDLPPIEIVPKKGNYFDYESKYEIGGSEEITPPVSIDKETSDKISHLTSKIHKLLNLKTYSRSDFLIKNGKIYFLEVNTLPGMTATSLLPKEASAKGITYSELLDFIITNS